MAAEGPHPDFELLFQSAPSLFLVLEPAPGFTILAASDSYLRATRSDRDAIVGRGLFEAFPGEGDADGASASLRASLTRVLTTRSPEITTIARYDLPQPEWQPGGQAPRFWRALNSPVLSPDGRLKYIIHRVEDGAPPPVAVAREPQPRRNKMELQLLRSARDRDDALRRLRSSNEELEAFAYCASHDLRPAVRELDALCESLGEQHAAARETVQRLAATIDGLLELSRIGKSRLVKKRVDVGAVALRVVEELRRREPALSLEVTADLEAYGDEALVQAALATLIESAWRHAARPQPRVEIGQHIFAGEKVFYVRNNGDGRDMAELDGHGIGIATVKRIIERHDGRIWGDAQPGRGATISFTFGV